MLVSPRSILTVLIACSLLIVAVGWTAGVLQLFPDVPTFPGMIRRRLDIDSEATIAAWYSSLLLFVASCLLAVAATAVPDRGRGGRRSWVVLSVVFLLLSMDEAVALHEMSGSILVRIGIQGGYLYYPWVIFGGLFIAVLFVYLVPWVRRLQLRTRNLFLLSAALFVGGALIVEMLGARVAESLGDRTVLYTTLAAVEDLLEMMGSSVFIYALLLHLRSAAGGIRIRIE